MKAAIIIAAGSNKQNECWWPSYYNSVAGVDHDIIVANRNMQFVPEVINKSGKVIYENKIYSTGELSHKAFGVYREYFRRYQNDYDVFAFISDDVMIKTDNWFLEAVEMLLKFNRLGFVGSQIFNGSNDEYPHDSHCRAPAWFAKSSALKEIKWDFDSDHDGEMKIADQFVAGGYFGAQVGNKIDIAYDCLECGGYFIGDHVSAILEKNCGHDLNKKWTNVERADINNRMLDKLENNDDYWIIDSPHQHIGKRKVISQIQPFSGLIYDRSLELASGFYKKYNFGIKLLK